MKAHPPPAYYLLRLYNANRTGEMSMLAKRFEEALSAQFPDQFRVEVIDVLRDPERAVEDQVFVTPTLVKVLPEPIRRVIGDLSDPKGTLMLLGVLALEEVKRDTD